MMMGARKLLVETGIPDDRVDYILMKWVKFVYPESLIDQKDCYFDKACHDKVDWKKVGELKMGIFKRLEMLKMKRASGAEVKDMMMGARKLLVETGIPDDRVDYILMKWVESVYPESVDEEVAGKAQMDEDANVDWVKVGKLKMGIFKRLEWLKTKRASGAKVKAMMMGARKVLVETGIPETKVDYMLMQWEKEVYPELFEELVAGKAEKEAKMDRKDRIDWVKVGHIKEGIFNRLKMMKVKRASRADVKGMLMRARKLFVEMGIPEEKVDYMLMQWAKFEEFASKDDLDEKVKAAEAEAPTPRAEVNV